MAAALALDDGPSLRPYPAYKNSGLPWLGTVPEHWQVLPNRALFIEVKDRNHPDEDMLSVTITRGVIPQRTLLSDGSKKDSSNRDKTAYKLVLPDDIVYNKMRAWQGAFGVSQYRGIVSPAYVVVRLRRGDAAGYFHHLLRTAAFAAEAQRWSYGIASDLWSLRPEHFKIIYCPLPPQVEQAAIVRFLDHADRRIRRYIAAKRKLVALLNEQRQAIIERAVTRGLDASVRLRQSGVHWLGDVPEHWRVLPLAAASESIQTGPFGSQLHAAEYVAGGVPVVNPSHLREGAIQPDPQVAVAESRAAALPRHRLKPGDVVAARRGELGRCALVAEGQNGWLCGTGSLRIRLRRDALRPEYFVGVLGSRRLREFLTLTSVGATMDNLNATTFGRLRIPCPPLGEQDHIVYFVRRESDDIRKAIATVEQSVALVREFGVRLIADLATGKLDVHEAAARLPDETDEAEQAELVADVEILTEGDGAADGSDVEDLSDEGAA